jgi:hypothetical protein
MIHGLGSRSCDVPDLPRLIPDADTLLALPPEELAFYVLRAAIDATHRTI